MSFGFRGKSHLVDNCFQKENNFKIQHILHLTRDIDLGRGWEGDARGRRYGDICIFIAD